MDEKERDGWRRRLAALSDALEAGDDRFLEVLRAGFDEQTRQLLREVGDVAVVMQDELKRFRHMPAFDNAATAELPEARKRIAYLAQMTEQAAHETLNHVEAAIRDCDSLRAGLASLEAGAQQRSMMHVAEGIRGRLQEMLLAQGYQDLAGQVLMQLDGFLADMEKGLARIGTLAGAKAGDASADQAVGPHVPGVDDAAYVEGQDDVDQLLADLGF
ncbi:MAG TPA: protein phosphatase CheZ [Gammaproteobacteria bacterium]|nr:protein phosphatase CheZ [Gammaproteobacteria bacterium]